ncbi:hypothetical protein QTP88_007539 [Uroleucon formosanum]
MFGLDDYNIIMKRRQHTLWCSVIEKFVNSTECQSSSSWLSLCQSSGGAITYWSCVRIIVIVLRIKTKTTSCFVHKSLNILIAQKSYLPISIILSCNMDEFVENKNKRGVEKEESLIATHIIIITVCHNVHLQDLLPRTKARDIIIIIIIYVRILLCYIISYGYTLADLHRFRGRITVDGSSSGGDRPKINLNRNRCLHLHSSSRRPDSGTQKYKTAAAAVYRGVRSFVPEDVRGVTNSVTKWIGSVTLDVR